jgi:glycosyltransferase involved in cell wall biosynthesis
VAGVSGRRDPSGVPRVLVVEELAHMTTGHKPVRFAQLATAYCELGFDVDVLTTWGWSQQAEHPEAPFTLHQFGWVAKNVRRVSGRLRGMDTRRQAGRLGNRVGEALTIFTVALAIRSRARRLPARPELTVILSNYTDPALLSALVGPGCWLLFQFRAATDTVRWPAGWLERSVVALARRTERTRRRQGGSCRVAGPTPEHTEQWSKYVPFLDPVTLPIAGTREFHTAADRARLALPADRRTALFFGGAWSKQTSAVIDAFRMLPEWTLVVAGAVAEQVDGTEVPGMVTMRGYLDDTTRDVLLASIDAMVLSFERAYYANSGTLMDAISAGIPVVCSGESSAAGLVEEFDLGCVFEPEDGSALAAAMQRVPHQIDPVALASAREALSNQAVARAQLVAFDLTPPC